MRECEQLLQSHGERLWRRDDGCIAPEPGAPPLTSHLSPAMASPLLQLRISNFISTVNCGDEMILSRDGSVEKGTGLIFGYGHEGYYLQDDPQRVDLGVTVTTEEVLLMAADVARDTGAELA